MEKNHQEVLVNKNMEAELSLVECIANVFSEVMEEEVTPQQASAIINLMCALIVVVFPVSIPVVLRIASVVWFGMAYYRCKQKGIIEE